MKKTFVVEQLESKYWDARAWCVITLEELQKRYMGSDAWREMSFAEYLGNLLSGDDFVPIAPILTLEDAWEYFKDDVDHDIELWKEECEGLLCYPTSFQGMELYYKEYAHGIELTMNIMNGIRKEMCC